MGIHQKKKYSVIIRSGGTYTWNECVSTENYVILFNSKHLYNTKQSEKKTKIINGYWCKLPSFRRECEFLSTVYNECNSTLFSFGGLSLSRSNKAINALALNCKNYKDVKWKKIASMKKARYSCSLINVGQKIQIIGGINNKFESMKHCELYDIDSNESVSISSMNAGRANCGCCFVADLNEGTIVVGGGVKYGDSSKQIELYNLHKNEWSVHSATTNYKHSFPTLWCGQLNPNIIYIAGDNIGISGGGRHANLGYIEWCDLRDSQKQFNVLYKDSIDKLWKFKFLNHHQHNGWESRSLFSI